ncbi:MAG: hypothetical protein IKE42_14495 [Aquamicrobium sp.]|uniref:hypothetical protein n=1 Tax=Mesorhizobium sp. Pch-S TaxID=2082387 RepID=UPI00101261F1|nr:hypothetical protein [Mesorhizobium sp. Pch-S]MBR2689057.1 hypothetical protein [Aquamicrobium sp.]QAZ44200.1 hypothetical protein C1M53_15870 [Mesorhizobium sp. Pch-S]
MQVRRTEVSTQIEGGDAYGYRVRFQGADGQFITVGFRADHWLDDDDAVKRQAIAMMAEAASTLGPLIAYNALRSGNIAPEGRLVDQVGIGQIGGDVDEEDDDSAYQENDEDLPGDDEEAAINRSPSGQGGRFDKS